MLNQRQQRRCSVHMRPSHKLVPLQGFCTRPGIWILLSKTISMCIACRCSIDVRPGYKVMPLQGLCTGPGIQILLETTVHACSAFANGQSAETISGCNANTAMNILMTGRDWHGSRTRMCHCHSDLQAIDLAQGSRKEAVEGG